MSQYAHFTVKAMRPDGTEVEFIVQPETGTLLLPSGTTHDEAFRAETALYNCLVRAYQGEDD